ncbi:MAG: DUF2203 family protein [Bdellovibrionales bacterium]|nr:DUF2203 family protein [Bdellovibrionales bacterium]
MELKSNVIAIASTERRTFSLDQARNLLPIVRKITETVAEQVEALLVKLESTNIENDKSISETENLVNLLIEKWHVKMAKLGVKGKGLWYVDFDHGNGYYCWKYPETDLFYQHSYEDGFTGRSLIDKSRPSSQQLKELGNVDEKEGLTWFENCSRTDQLSPWRL